MLKYIVIFFNFLGFLGYRLLFPGGVSITSDLPTSINPGEDVVITVNVSKGDVSGFAKFSQDLPEGFTASVVEGGDATFSFKEQKVKFIWVALPAVSDFSFSYRIAVDPSVHGNFEITGIFSYIFDNEKQNAELDKKMVQVGDAAVVMKGEDVVKGMVGGESGDIRVRRTTSPIPGMSNTFQVELRIDKPGITGFAKIEESIPEGFYASEMESKGGIFTFEGQLLKIIWMAIPESNECHVSYQLKARDNVSGNQKITGVFSYLRGDESAQYFVPPSTIFIEQDPGEAVPMIIIADEGGDFQEKEKKPAPPKPKEVPVVPAPQADITYRVQVAAGHQPVANNYFSKKFNLGEDIAVINHQGWIKYTFGNFDLYLDCRDRRNRVWSENKISDAFVTAYNAGTRITVQEALMITSQKWYN